MDVVWVARIWLRLGKHNLPDIRRHQMGVIGAGDLGRPQRHSPAGHLVKPSLAGVAAGQVAAQPDHGQQDQGDASSGIASISALGGDVVEDLAQRRKRVCLFAEMHLFLFCKTRWRSLACLGSILLLLCCRRSRYDTQHNTTQLSNKHKMTEWKE